MTATGYVSTTGDSRKVSKTGDTMTGALVLPGDPTSALQAADKHYVDSQVAGVPTTRNINTTAPVTGGGDLSADRTLAVSNATAGAVGVMQLAGDLAGTATAPTVPGKVPLSTVTTKGDLVAGTGNAAVTRLAAGADGQILIADSAQSAGLKYGQPATLFVYSLPGTVAVAAGTARIYNDTGRTLAIKSIRTSVGTAPTGASLIVDVNKNGTTVFTTQGNRPTIAISGNTSGKVTNMDVTTVADGDYITVDVDAVGSGVAGADLTVQIWLA